MRWFNRTGILLAVLLGGAGCHSSGGAATGTGGAGDTSGTGGQAATDGAVDRTATANGGAGGGGPRDASADSKGGSGLGRCLGVCLETFYALCPKIDQSCVTATMSNGEVVNCYANGVKQAQQQSGGTTTEVVLTTNGQTCYESDLTASVETIKALDGKMIAQITHTSATQLTIECYDADGSAATQAVDLTSAACAAYYASSTQTCTAGTCTLP
jgi:hypothetical protein